MVGYAAAVAQHFVLLVLLAALRVSGKGLGPHTSAYSMIRSLTWWLTDLLLLNIGRPAVGQILCQICI